MLSVTVTLYKLGGGLGTVPVSVAVVPLEPPESTREIGVTNGMLSGGRDDSGLLCGKTRLMKRLVERFDRTVVFFGEHVALTVC
jgi:hypothetical protein